MRRGLEKRAGRKLLIVAILTAGGCAPNADGDEKAAPAPGGGAPVAAPRQTPPTDTVPPGDPATGDLPAADTAGGPWTLGIVDRRRPNLTMTVLQDVRTARHPGFDRVVFQFSGTEIPGYHLEYVDRPVRQCGSGDAVRVAGDGWLAVRLEPSQAHDDQGRATVQQRERTLNLPVLKELRSICDFEGQVEWVLGVGSPNRFRVMELRAPARLVVDVRH